MLKKYIKLILLIISPLNVYSQVDTVTHNRFSDYNDWDWETIVLKNRFVTAAFVPSMGGCMMQYDFGIDTFLILNPSTFGFDYDPYIGQNPFQGSWGFGGCQTWTTPEEWPPPAVLTWGTYDDTILIDHPDTVKLLLRSPKEITPITDIQFEKYVTLACNSSGIEVTTVLYNHRNAPLNAGIMVAAYVTTQHGTSHDHENFSVYFPVSKLSSFGEAGVYISPSSPAFIGEVIPGIFSVEYVNRRGKVYADSPAGWIAYVDERDHQTYVFLFDIFSGEEYPEPGAWTEVYVEGQVPFMAIEALNPLNVISSDGGSVSFTHHFYATKLGLPVVSANHAGAVAAHLQYDSLSQAVSGTFGVFNTGELQLFFKDSTGYTLHEGTPFSVNPDTTIYLSDNTILPEGTRYIELLAYNIRGDLIGTLDSVDLLEAKPVSLPVLSSPGTKFNLLNNVLFDSNELYYILNLDEDAYLTIELFDQTGSRQETIFSGIKERGQYSESIIIGNYPPGMYFVRFASRSNSTNNKIVIL